MSKRKANTGKAIVANIVNVNKAECSAVRQAVAGLLAANMPAKAVDVAKAWRGHLATAKAERLATAKQEAENAAAALLEQVSFLKPAKPTVTGMAESLLRVLACMPNKQGTSAAAINAAIYGHVQNGHSFTLPSLSNECNCSVRRILGHLGTGKSALNGRLQEYGLRLIVNDKQAYLVNTSDKSQRVMLGK